MKTRKREFTRRRLFTFGAVNLLTSLTIYLVSGEVAPLMSFGAMGIVCIALSPLLPKEPYPRVEGGTES